MGFKNLYILGYQCNKTDIVNILGISDIEYMYINNWNSIALELKNTTNTSFSDSIFILEYFHPKYILSEVFKKEFPLNKKKIDTLLEEWYFYNNEMIKFYYENSKKCIVLNSRNLQNKSIIEARLKEKKFFNFKCDFKADNLAKDESDFCNFLEEIISDTNETTRCFDELEKIAINPIEKTLDDFCKIDSRIKFANSLIYENKKLKTKYNKALEFIFTDFQNKISKNTDEQKSIICGSARMRIRGYLSYRLGQVVVKNSKTVLGTILIPLLLVSIVISFQQEKKNYKEEMKKDPSLSLPPLEAYPDYKKAIAMKNHLSYKLGEVLIKDFKNWHKGDVFKLPFDIYRVYKNFKKEKQR